MPLPFSSRASGHVGLRQRPHLGRGQAEQPAQYGSGVRAEHGSRAGAAGTVHGER